MGMSQRGKTRRDPIQHRQSDEALPSMEKSEDWASLLHWQRIIRPESPPRVLY
ncbi:hypothetical protein XFPR_12975 [Xylella fastidiosa]|uniref:hypothetical protein n=1 Tax=Xylella fastidiosa TaxID=2371 RepID=UPI0003FC0A24|nr:hypothetical protein [Xylella fastidiosa]QPB72943.1 hypothetical protein XFPR_12975 [Xylella fastidiosa]